MPPTPHHTHAIAPWNYMCRQIGENGLKTAEESRFTNCTSTTLSSIRNNKSVIDICLPVTPARTIPNILLLTVWQ